MIGSMGDGWGVTFLLTGFPLTLLIILKSSMISSSSKNKFNWGKFVKDNTACMLLNLICSVIDTCKLNNRNINVVKM